MIYYLRQDDVSEAYSLIKARLVDADLNINGLMKLLIAAQI